MGNHSRRNPGAKDESAGRLWLRRSEAKPIEEAVAESMANRIGMLDEVLGQYGQRTAEVSLAASTDRSLTEVRRWLLVD